MALFDSIKQGFGIPQNFYQEQPAQRYTGGVPNRPALNDGFQTESSGFSPMDFDFNSPAKSNESYQEEETAPVQEMPIKPAVGIPEFKAAPQIEEAPAQRSGIATGESRDRLLKLAGMPTDAERSKVQSDARTQEQLYKIAGLNYKNPEQQGIDTLEQARRYQEIANDPRTKGTMEGNFARNAFDKIMKSSGGQLQQSAKDEQARAAAQAEGAKQAEDKRRFEEDLALRKAGNAREEALQGGKLQEQQLSNLQKSFDVESNPLKKQQLQAQINELLASGEDKRSNAAVRREGQTLEKEKFGFQKEQAQQADTANTIKDFQSAINSGIQEAQKNYQADLAKLTSGLSSKTPSQVKAEHEQARQQILNNAIGAAVQTGKARGLNDAQIQDMIKVSVPGLTGVAPGELQRAIGAFKDIVGPIANIAYAANGGTNINTGG